MHARAMQKNSEGVAIGLIDVRVCDSMDHTPRLARKRLHWVDGPVEYCDPCCAHMLLIAETLGFVAHVEEIPAPPLVLPAPERRAMNLEETTA